MDRLQEKRRKKNMDRLQRMLDIQKSFQQKVGFDFDKMELKDKASYAKEMQLWMIDESCEALHELPFAKGWSKRYDSWSRDTIDTHINSFKDEMIDSFHFFMNIMLVFGITSEEIYNRYIEKNKENIARQNNNY